MLLPPANGASIPLARIVPHRSLSAVLVTPVADRVTLLVATAAQAAATVARVAATAVPAAPPHLIAATAHRLAVTFSDP